MRRRIWSALILVAFVNYVIGCSNTYVEKVSTHQAIKEQEKIDQLVLKNGMVVQFDENGGAFSPNSKGIEGVTNDSIPMFIFLHRIVELRTSLPVSIPEVDLDGATIAEVVLPNKKLITFDEAGARYEKDRRTITGRKVTGEMFSYPAPKMLSVRTTKPEASSRSEFLQDSERVVYEVVAAGDFLFVFGSDGGRYKDEASVFVGVNSQGEFLGVPANEVLYANVTKADIALNILATLGVLLGFVGVLFIIALATKQSCPFVYSYDGERYVFDAEPLGGAICQGLERTDYSRLDHLAAVDGKYKLLVRNEVPETQYLDDLKLAVVDHPVNTMIVSDQKNTLRCIAPPTAALAAVDEHGMSLMNFLVARDGVAWQTHLPTACTIDSGSFRHHLTITLPKPKGATSATLVVNAGTALWGSNMIRKTLEYRGDQVDQWLAKLSPGSEEYRALYTFIEREELYYLKVNVKEADSWIPRAVIRGGGPLITEDKAIPLDLRNVQGDSLIIQLQPPLGFWSIDYVGVDYGVYDSMTVTELPVFSAMDHNSTDILAQLEDSDQQYYTMPEVGDWAKVSFTVPPQSEGTMRSLFLKTTGYYELHLAKNTPERKELLDNLISTPGYVVRVAMEEYKRWRAVQRVAYEAKSEMKGENTKTR